MPKPNCNLLVAKATSEYVQEPESKLLIVTFEAPLNSKHVDRFWEAMQWQEKAYQYAIYVEHKLKQSCTRQLKYQDGKCLLKEPKKIPKGEIEIMNVPKAL